MNKYITTLALILTLFSTVFADDTIRFSFIDPSQGPDSLSMDMTDGDEIQSLHVEKTPIISNDDIESAVVEPGAETPLISLFLTEEGATKFDNAIHGRKGEQLAIILNGRLVSAPFLQTESLGNRIQIQGNFSEEEASDLAEGLSQK